MRTGHQRLRSGACSKARPLVRTRLGTEIAWLFIAPTIVLLLAITFVLVAELVNTAIEAAVAFAKASPLPQPEDALQDVFAP